MATKFTDLAADVSVQGADEFLIRNASDGVFAKTTAGKIKTFIGVGTGDALVANPLSQFAATTSLQLKDTISDETGSGALVFGTSPAISTPTGIVKGDVGLGSADNTADTAKPVSTVQQAAIDLKANIASPTFTGLVTLPVGTSGIAPLNIPAGTLKTTPAAGDYEFDGVNHYATIDATSRRGAIPVQQYFFLDADGGTISTIANFFGVTSNISLVASAYYEIEIFAYFLNTSAGTVVWTFTNSAAPTSQNIHFRYSLVGGVNAAAGSTAYFDGDIVKNAGAVLALTATGTLTDGFTNYAHFKIWLKNGSGTSLKIQATKSAGTITPLLGSYYTVRRLPAINTGTFVA